MTKTVLASHQDNGIPGNILLEKWADIGFEWRGNVSAYDFDRLKRQLVEDSLIQVSVCLSKQEGILWLSFGILGSLMVDCQRCLMAMAVDVSGDYRVAILREAAEASMIDDAEFVLIDEVCAGDGRKMLPLKAMLEDELLLIVPLSPRHDDCQMPVEQIQDEEEAENPFAVLASLKGKLS